MAFRNPPTLAHVAQGYEKIFEVVTNTALYVVDTGVGGIPQTHDNLRIVIIAETHTSSNLNSGMKFYFNGDGSGGSSSNYDAQIFLCTGTSGPVNAAQAFASTISALIKSDQNLSLYPSYFMCDMFDYRDTTYWKTGQFYNGYFSLPGGSNNCLYFSGSIGWRSTAAITQFGMTSTDIINAGATIRIYGY